MTNFKVKFEARVGDKIPMELKMGWYYVGQVSYQI